MNPSLHLDEFVLLNERSCIISINVDVSRSVDHELFESRVNHFIFEEF